MTESEKMMTEPEMTESEKYMTEASAEGLPTATAYALSCFCLTV